MKYSEKWGDSIDNAVELALAELKLTRDQVEVTVLEEPSRGFFGLGSKLAKVRVEEKKDETPAPEEGEALREEREPARADRVVKREGDKEILIELCGVDEAPVQERRPSRRSGRRGVRKSDVQRQIKPAAESFSFGAARIFGERPADLELKEDHPARIFLSDIIDEMGLDVNITVSANADSVFVDVEGPDAGTVIGKRGKTLDALQYLTSLVVNKNEQEYIKVVIDAEGYRQKREIALEKLALRLADKARKTDRSVRLEPMNPYERKVIHTALQKVEGVATKSEGEEPYRRVVIEPKR